MADESVTRAAKVKNAHATIANALGELSRLFEPRCHLTFLMRDPHDMEGFVLVTDDELFKVIEQLKLAEKAEERKLTHEEVFAHSLGLEMPK